MDGEQASALVAFVETLRDAMSGVELLYHLGARHGHESQNYQDGPLVGEACCNMALL